jgi:hypothetical protein
MLKEGFFDPGMLGEQADEVVKEMTSVSDFDKTKVSEDGGVLFGYPYEEFVYTYVDDGIEYQIDYTMILKDKDLFMFIGMSSSDYSNTALDIFVGSLSSVSFF